jgi:hypothetical protein
MMSLGIFQVFRYTHAQAIEITRCELLAKRREEVICMTTTKVAAYAIDRPFSPRYSGDG